MRRLISFPCLGATLIGSLDDGPRTTGLLVVSGGNEIRCGAHRGMAMLATALNAQGTPVFRFDRRGIGDSSGDNGGFASSGPDIMAAVAAFRAACPQVNRLVGFGNCDAATALLLHHGGAFDHLVLANPWLIDDDDGLPPAAAIRSRYFEGMRNPDTWKRLVSGGVDIHKLIKGISKIVHTKGKALADFERVVFNALNAAPATTIILARGDATALAFSASAARAGYAGDRIIIDTDSHSFSRPADKAALMDAVARTLG